MCIGSDRELQRGHSEDGQGMRQDGLRPRRSAKGTAASQRTAMAGRHTAGSQRIHVVDGIAALGGLEAAGDAMGKAGRA